MSVFWFYASAVLAGTLGGFSPEIIDRVIVWRASRKDNTK